MNEPWYHQGLKFQCIGCGDCCSGAPGYVWVNKAEIAALAAALGLPVEEFQRQFVRSVGVRKSLLERANGDCVLLNGETRQCQVYDARPRQCRTWPFWPSNLSSPEAWETTAERCPGCNRGRRVFLGKILAQVQMLRV
jgi:uncharacterized protein